MRTLIAGRYARRRVICAAIGTARFGATPGAKVGWLRLSKEQGPSGPFPSTHWSAVNAAAQERHEGERPALAELLRRYLPALRAHVLMRRSSARDQVDDLVQGFISSKVLEADLVGRADRAKGKFRSFLLTALDRYVVSRQRHDAAAKRGAWATRDLPSEVEPAAPVGPVADTFDVAWARQVVSETLARVRAQCEADGRPDVWGVFESRVLKPALEGAAPPGYEQIVERYGYRAPTQMWNAVRTGKHIFARALRSVIAEYSGAGEAVEAELRDLREICARLPPADVQDDPPHA
jgi:RNA polymerase sigma-70 factor (ECF subfamily)